jgi:D-sedoheptulose 7-phosphate isomerase
MPYDPNISSTAEYFAEMRRVAQRVPQRSIERLVGCLLHAYEQERMVFLFGNGGSAALASHFACDLGKGTADCVNGRRFRVLALTDNIPVMTAWANDSSYEHVFAEQLSNLVRKHDVALGISGSGNSQNVLNALEVASAAGAVTLGITGFLGGKMRSLCKVCVVIPSDNMQIIEDLHLVVAHSVFTMLRQRLRALQPDRAVLLKTA